MKYNILCCAVGVLCGLFLGLMYGAATFSNNLLPVSVSVPVPKELQKEVKHFETSYAKSFDTLKKESDKLTSELTASKSELQKAKQRSMALQGQVYSLLDSRFEKQQADTTTATTPCDTLANEVVELMEAAAQKDTLYEQVTANLEEQVKTKDTTIGLKDAQYADLKTVFEKSINNQQFLQEQNTQLTKEYKKQKVKSKLLSAILFAVSGAAATYFIHH